MQHKEGPQIRRRLIPPAGLLPKIVRRALRSLELRVYVTHVLLICAFAGLGALLPPTFVQVLAGGYALGFVALLARRVGPSGGFSLLPLALIHVVASAVLMCLGFAERVIPVVGGPLSFASTMLFYVLNYPALPFARLLPQSQEHATLVEAVWYFTLVAITVAWFFVAAKLARLWRRGRDH